jgi:hypothetical protein
MKQVQKVMEAEGDTRTFEITLTDGNQSPFTLIKDEGEWVLQGDAEQRFSASELRAILQGIDNLNRTKKR